MNSASVLMDRVHNSKRHALREYFSQCPGLNADLASATEATRVPVNREFEILGANMTSALVTYSIKGGITITTAGADNDAAIVTPHLDTKQTAWAATGIWGTENSPAFEARIATAANISDAEIWAGLKLTNTEAVATDDNQIYFRYDAAANGGKWTLVISRAGTDSTFVTDEVVAVSTEYRLRIEVYASLEVMGFINDKPISDALFPAVITAINLIPYVGVQAQAAAAKAIDVRYLECSRLIAS